MPDASRILEPAFVEALRGYADEDIPVDLLVTADRMDEVLELLRQVPRLRGIVDHLAKPGIRERRFEPWASRLSELARLPNLYGKMSGLVTEADSAAWKTEDFVPYIRHALHAFGPERVLFGSDWPVCLLAAPYGQVTEILRQALPDEWGERERALLFGGNAILSYCHYSLNDNSLLGLLPLLQERGVGVVNASPLSMGLLGTRPIAGWHPAGEKLRAACRMAAEHCAAKGSDIAKLAVQYSTRNERIPTTLVSTATPANIVKNAAWTDEPLDEELLREVLDILKPVHNVSWVSGRPEYNGFSGESATQTEGGGR